MLPMYITSVLIWDALQSSLVNLTKPLSLLNLNIFFFSSEVRSLKLFQQQKKLWIYNFDSLTFKYLFLHTFTQFKNPKDKIVNNEKSDSPNQDQPNLPHLIPSEATAVVTFGYTTLGVLCANINIYLFSLFIKKKGKLDIDNNLKIAFLLGNAAGVL